MRGTGSETASFVGTCSGVGCGSSARHCQCMQFEGTLASTVVGNSNWTADITVNEDDCTNTGTSVGVCCIGDGVFTATSKTTASNVLAFSFIGPICIDPNSSTNAALLGSSMEANFQVLGAASGGKWLDSTGTGQINIVTYENGATTDSYLAVLGEIQSPK